MIDEALTEKIIGALIEVHRYWGPGLRDEIYENSMVKELTLRDIACVNQVTLPLDYKGTKVGNDLKLDLLIENRVVVEVKVVKKLLPVHEAQLLTYMKLTKCRVGFLVNFYEAKLMDGLKRFVL